MSIAYLKYKFVKLVYADHNSSKSVRRAIAKTLAEMGPDDYGLNLGAGGTRIHPRMRNMDIFEADNIDIVGRAESIPLENNSLRVVVTQEVLEHVEHPFVAVSEIYRVLVPGGALYCQLPFIIGYHPGPTDFWRFTKEGIASMLTSAGFAIEEQGISVGSGSGLYRILVEFASVLFSIPLPFLYRPLKAFFAILLFPIKWLDFLFAFSRERDRIAGGYYVIARKPLANRREELNAG